MTRAFASQTHATLTVRHADGSQARIDVPISVAQGFVLGQALTIQIG